MFEPEIDDEIRQRALEWWHELPAAYKGNCSIWILLAMFHQDEMKRLENLPAKVKP
jgi:hypothetical protein